MRISLLTAISMLALSSGGNAQVFPVELQKLDLCLEEDDRVDRLACYDLLFERPADPPPLLPDPEPIASGTGEIPDETQYLRTYLNTPTVTDEGIAVTVRAIETGEAILTNPETFLDDLRTLQTEADSEEFRLGHNVFLALSSLEIGGEEGLLLISCENNITHLRTIWTKPYNRSVIETRFSFGDELANADQRIDVAMRARPGGFELLAPRGLESIRILGRAVSGQRLQITSGESADELRSLFFDTEPLRAALPLVARQCSWSVQTFRREF